MKRLFTAEARRAQRIAEDGRNFSALLRVLCVSAVKKN
jgi:hypothetical protein